MEILFPLWTNRTFDWTPRDLGYCFAYIGILMVFIQGTLIGPLTKWLSSRRLLLIGLILLGIGLLMTIFSGNVPLFIVATTFIVFGIGILTPTQSSVISLASAKGQQGVTLGVANTASGFGRVAPGRSGLGCFLILCILMRRF